VRFVAAHHERPIEALRTERPMQRESREQRREAKPAAVSCARIDPRSRERRMALQHPRVVIVREEMDLRVRKRGVETREHGRRQQKVAELVAFDDQHSHGDEAWGA
jgi:hypothetical protein